MERYEAYLCIFGLGGAGVQPVGRPLLCRRAGAPARATARRDRPGAAQKNRMDRRYSRMKPCREMAN